MEDDQQSQYSGEHSHGHSHDHIFEYRSVEKRKLLLSLSITTVVMVLEIVGGILTNSIALISDGGHMFTHAFAISISLVAIVLASKPACHHRTFGLFRAEILAAFINGLFLLVVGAIIIYEAVLRMIDPVEVESINMLGIALIGLVTNLASILILRGSHKHDVNIRGVFYHMLADAASSVGIVIAGVIIYYTNWNIIDPLVSLGISALIMLWAYDVLKESTCVLLEMAPKGMDVDTISSDIMTSFPGVGKVYDVHLWTINPQRIAFTAHIKLRNGDSGIMEQSEIITGINEHLKEKYGITGTTIQVAEQDACEDCNLTCVEAKSP